MAVSRAVLPVAGSEVVAVAGSEVVRGSGRPRAFFWEVFGRLTGRPQVPGGPPALRRLKTHRIQKMWLPLWGFTRRTSP